MGGYLEKHSKQGYGCYVDLAFQEVSDAPGSPKSGRYCARSQVFNKRNFDGNKRKTKVNFWGKL